MGCIHLLVRKCAKFSLSWNGSSGNTGPNGRTPSLAVISSFTLLFASTRTTAYTSRAIEIWKSVIGEISLRKHTIELCFEHGGVEFSFILLKNDNNYIVTNVPLPFDLYEKKLIWLKRNFGMGVDRILYLLFVFGEKWKEVADMVHNIRSRNLGVYRLQSRCLVCKERSVMPNEWRLLTLCVKTSGKLLPPFEGNTLAQQVQECLKIFRPSLIWLKF